MGISTSRALLDRFPDDKRSKVMNWFLFGVREGCSTPEDVVAYVRWRSVVNCDPEVYGKISDHPEESLVLARYALAWESLPKDKRKELEEASRQQYREDYMRQQPPTEKQLEYLSRLGYRGAVSNRLEASLIIKNLEEQRSKRANKWRLPKSP
jgi:hypothetical protein